MKYLIFFDINGTIIKRDERTDLPFTYAINKLLSLDNAMDNVDTSARSDKDVFIEVIAKKNLQFNEDLWQKFLILYEEQLNSFWDTDVWRENVDAIAFIKYVHEAGHLLSLITGELSIGAEYKLKKLGVWQYFKTGGFGEDGLKRFDIADQALEKAHHTFSESYDKMFVIGDTQLDILTARHLGAKIISITTGSHSKEKLLELKPDYIIDEFNEVKSIF